MTFADFGNTTPPILRESTKRKQRKHLKPIDNTQLAVSLFRLTGNVLISICGNVILMRGLDLLFYAGLARLEGSAYGT